jgi:WD repeat-containing protein 59
VTFKAHDAIIYGIDWSRHSEYELSTCSLDKTVKFWDTRTMDKDEHDPGAQLLDTIQTDYPVWRARNLPFGRGVLTQPHRGYTQLDMYRADKVDEPVHTFEGFGGVVKEYVWRLKGGENDAYGMHVVLSR